MTHQLEATLRREGVLLRRSSARPPRWRRILDQTREDVDRATDRPKMGLPSLMRPILKQAEGVLEDALEYEVKRRAAPSTH